MQCGPCRAQGKGRQGGRHGMATGAGAYHNILGGGQMGGSPMLSNFSVAQE